MQIINRLSFLLVTFLLCYGSVYSQTQADVKMGEILNGGDLFQLRKEYPKLRDSVSVKDCLTLKKVFYKLITRHIPMQNVEIQCIMM